MTEIQTKICLDCKQEKSISDFYKQPKHLYGVMSYCKTCFNKRCQKRWIQRKVDAIKYKGSKCNYCPISLETSHYCVFDFHHLDPSQKDYDWAKLRLHPIRVIKQELDKCILVCCMCHRLLHANQL